MADFLTGLLKGISEGGVAVLKDKYERKIKLKAELEKAEKETKDYEKMLKKWKAKKGIDLEKLSLAPSGVTATFKPTEPIIEKPSPEETRKDAEELGLVLDKITQTGDKLTHTYTRPEDAGEELKELSKERRKIADGLAKYISTQDKDDVVTFATRLNFLLTHSGNEPMFKANEITIIKAIDEWVKTRKEGTIFRQATEEYAILKGISKEEAEKQLRAKQEEIYRNLRYKWGPGEKTYPGADKVIDEIEKLMPELSFTRTETKKETKPGLVPLSAEREEATRRALGEIK